MALLGYYFERGYPYIISAIVSWILFHLKIDIRTDGNYTELLNGLVNLESIIIGFIGAIMPAVLSMRNESKFVRYVFERDKRGLFGKYVKSTILVGLISASSSLIMQVRESMSDEISNNVYHFWIFISILFLILTYRSMSHMTSLIFAKDNGEEKEIKRQSVSNVFEEIEVKSEFKNPNL